MLRRGCGSVGLLLAVASGVPSGTKRLPQFQTKQHGGDAFASMRAFDEDMQRAKKKRAIKAIDADGMNPEDLQKWMDAKRAALLLDLDPKMLHQLKPAEVEEVFVKAFKKADTDKLRNELEAAFTFLMEDYIPSSTHKEQTRKHYRETVHKMRTELEVMQGENSSNTTSVIMKIVAAGFTGLVLLQMWIIYGTAMADGKNPNIEHKLVAIRESMKYKLAQSMMMPTNPEFIDPGEWQTRYTRARTWLKEHQDESPNPEIYDKTFNNAAAAVRADAQKEEALLKELMEGKKKEVEDDNLPRFRDLLRKVNEATLLEQTALVDVMRKRSMLSAPAPTADEPSS